MFLMASYLTCPSELLLAAGNMFLVSPDLVTDIGSFAYGPSKKTNKQKKQNTTTTTKKKTKQKKPQNPNHRAKSTDKRMEAEHLNVLKYLFTESGRITAI